MTVRLGMFTMPFHHPDARLRRPCSKRIRRPSSWPIGSALPRPSSASISRSWSERITSPLIFFATLIRRTTQIRFGTGVINLPQLHPATVAAHAAMFDQLARGRFIMGIGPGGLVSDLEMFDSGQAELRPQMVLESIDTVLKLWSQDPPYEIDGRFWKISLEQAIWPEFKVGYVPRPYQQPHPPIALSILTPNSSSARTAGERGWIPISGQFFHRRYLRGSLGAVRRGLRAGRPAAGSRHLARVAQRARDRERRRGRGVSGGSGQRALVLLPLLPSTASRKGRKALFMLKPDLLTCPTRT